MSCIALLSGACSGPAGVDAESPAGGAEALTTTCGSTAAPPTNYQHIVVFAFENRTWSNVGLGFSATTMPYLQLSSATDLRATLGI